MQREPVLFTRVLAPALLAVATSCGQPTPEPPAVEPPCSLDADGGVPMTPAASCPNDLPTTDDCPTATPSYQGETGVIVQTHCATCHASTAVSRYAFVTYDAIARARQAMLTQVYACRMPPTCAPTLSGSERRALLKWLVCGAPDN